MTRLRKAFVISLFFTGVLFYYLVARPAAFLKVWLRTHSVRMECDRCGKYLGRLDYEGESYTAGYYIVYGESPWAKYAAEGERYLCDACMWADARYQRVYGIHR